MRLQVMMVLVAGFLVAADDPKKEAEKLQGTWRLVSLEVDGKKATKGDIKKEQKMVVRAISSRPP